MSYEDIKAANIQIKWEQDSRQNALRKLEDAKTHIRELEREVAALKLEAREAEIQRTRIGP